MTTGPRDIESASAALSKSSAPSSSSSSAPTNALQCRVITFHTSAGAFSIELYDAFAPRLTQHMYDLARHKAYDGTLFHKLVPGAFVQGGIVDTTTTTQRATTTTTSSIVRKSALAVFLDDESAPALRFTGAGVVGFANAGPDLNSSQFFITLAPQPKFDGVYSVVGRVSSGMKVLHTLSTQYQVDPSTFAPYNPIRVSHCSCGTYPRQRRPSVASVARSNNTNKRPRDESGHDVDQTTTHDTPCATVFKPLKLFSTYAT